MMAHASSADAPLDSNEVLSNADLDSEAFATTPSATTSSLSIDILAQLMDTTTTTTSNNTQNNSGDVLLSDHSILAMTTTTSSTSTSSWATSPSISPMVLKLESPLLSHLEIPSTKKSSSSTRRASTSSSTNNSRKRTADPADKEAKARERVLRNRAAAQESRDKKRKYVSEIEASNEALQQENCHLLKRLKTVESDNLSLHERLEALTAQFAQMQELLSTSSSSSVKLNNNNNNNQHGVGFCQSAVLAKKDRRSRQTDNLTNSPQQKLAPTQKNPHTTISTNNKHRRVSSMTMKTSSMTSKASLNREARSLSDQSAAPQTWMEISCRPFCNNINNSCRRKKALTLSSSAAASFPPATTTQSVAACMMAFHLANTLLPQLMLNFSTLFLISTGALSSNPQPPLPLLLQQQEQELRQAVLSFIQHQQQQPQQLSNAMIEPQRTTTVPGFNYHLPQSRTIKDDITSLAPSVIEEIVTEFRQGRKQVARGLLVRALVSSQQLRMTLDTYEIYRRLSLLRNKK
ncbi:hypothetical protein BGZ95_012167 [Linnemannia exigua]|uniref:BZIP domain-containing protein n=1 Tax=Linnemannia exigua TaxID=604196 RepID=A0AAD4H4Q8_9FUNG|nr:hypothetical protein BGZ95_012167 [Linnemannia exigua]